MRLAPARTAPARHALAGSALAAALFFSGGASAAMAPKAVADALGAAYATAAQKGDAKYESAVARGNDVVIRKMFVIGAVASYEIAEIVVSNPTPRGDKAGFTASRIASSNSTTNLATALAVTLTAATTVLEDVTVLPPGETDPLLGSLRYKKGASSDLKITEASVGRIMNATRSTYERIDLPNGAQSYIIGTEGVTMPISLFGPEEPFTKLGYSGDLKGSFLAEGTFDAAAGTLALTNFSVALADIGTLSLSASLAGLASDKIMDASLSMEDRMMALYTSGTLASASIRFDNAGIVERVLDQQAKAAGVARPALATSMARALPLLLTPAIADAAFRSEFANAAGKFLVEPRAIVVSGAPEKPMPLASLVLSVETLPAVLRLKARAEQ